MLMTEPIHRLLEGAAPNERSSCTQPQPNRASAAEVTGYDGSLGTDERRSTSHTIPKNHQPCRAVSSGCQVRPHLLVED